MTKLPQGWGSLWAGRLHPTSIHHCMWAALGRGFDLAVFGNPWGREGRGVVGLAVAISHEHLRGPADWRRAVGRAPTGPGVLIVRAV